VNNPLPLNCGPLEIDKETNTAARRSQIVETLRHMFVRETIYTLQLDHNYVLDNDVSEILSNALSFVCNGKRRLRICPYATNAQFYKECALVDFLQKSSPQRVGDFKYGAEHLFSQRIKSVFICVHPWPIFLGVAVDPYFSKHYRPPMNTDEHR
jgi:hypothetical protein